MQTFGPVEDDPEYRLILSANNFIVEIDNELFIIHKVAFLTLLCTLATVSRRCLF